MRGPAVYVERDPSGQRLVGLRLIGDLQEERYSVPNEADALEVVRFAAEWLRARIDATSGGNIGLLCLDPRGAVCSWLDVPGSDASVVRAAVRQKSAGAWGDWTTMPALEAAETVESLVPVGGSSLEPLGEKQLAKSSGQGLIIGRKKTDDAAAPSRRAAVLALGDLPVKLLIDALDEMKIEVAQVTSLWHAIASAWDPAGEIREDNDPLVSVSRVDTAVLLVEPDGRVQWAWCDEGELLAAGSAMIEPDAFIDDERAREFGSGRLAMDWLAWTAQLGRSPKRVLCLIDQDEGATPGAGAFGQAIHSVWPGASLDLLRVDDPILTTFLRLQERTAGGKAKRRAHESKPIESLASRPGRAHRGMYRWVAGVILIGAVALGVLGTKLRSSADDARKQAAELSVETNALIVSELGANADPMYPILSLQSAISALQLDQQGGDYDPIRPVLLSVDEIAMFLEYMNGVTLARLQVDQSLNYLELEAESTTDAEAAPNILIDNARYVNWGNATVRQTSANTLVNIQGYWRDLDEQEDGE
ncbi:MAG: hypothetical protein Phyf2KO_22160 [Phycisphaerales bacterium]